LVANVLCGVALALGVARASAEPLGPRVVVLTLDGTVEPASLRYVKRGIETAARKGAALVLLEIDTPGGLVISLRDMTSAIAQSRAPVAAYVMPSGGRAASAGFFLLLAADIAAMAPGTNTGAAHPVTVGGRGLAKDMADKMASDIAALARSLAARHGRSIEAAERAVLQSASYTEREALEKKLIDVVAASRGELLTVLDGRQIQRLDGRTETLRLAGAVVEVLTPTLRDRLLMIIARPDAAYLLMLLGILGILAEVLHPGAIVPGTVGAVSLLLALFAFSVLPVNLVGALLIIVGLGLFAAEAVMTSHGALTVGGLVSFVLGSTLLIDSPLPGARVSLRVVLPATVVMAAASLLMLVKAARARWAIPLTGAEGLIGEEGEVVLPLDPEGKVLVHGEYWDAIASEPAPRGTRVLVTAVEGGMRLRVTATPAIA
jgi:membrane-bound serine protease (ClpP class)